MFLQGEWVVTLPHPATLPHVTHWGLGWRGGGGGEGKELLYCSCLCSISSCLTASLLPFVAES